jgi:septal ring factor EnvC (AmiA/AmiB activator)
MRRDVRDRDEEECTMRSARAAQRERSRQIRAHLREMEEHLQQMKEQMAQLDEHLRREEEADERWHSKWDDPSEE